MIEHFHWSDDALEMMRREFIAGLSGTQIANLLNATFHANLTRSAVIGKLHRAGLTRDRYPRATMPHLVSVKTAKPPKPPKPIREKLLPVARLQPVTIDRKIPAATVAVISRDPKAIAHPMFGGCRWPLELFDPQGERMFCCEPKANGKPYCQGHGQRANTKFMPAELRDAEREQARRNMAAAVAAGRQAFCFVGNGKAGVAA